MITAQEVVERAHRCVGKGCRYVLGKGGMQPEAEFPWRMVDGSPACDCSGFAMWCLKLSRLQEAVWYDTTRIESDAKSVGGLFVKVPLREAKPGDLIVYGDPPEGGQGHVGVIIKCGEFGPLTAIHCSKGNMRRVGDAIAEGNTALWLAKDGIVARCTLVEYPA